MALPNSKNGRFARGGNAVFHSLSMLSSNIFRLAFISTVVWVGGTLWASYEWLSNSYGIVLVYLQSWFWASTFQENHPVYYHLWGKTGQAPAQKTLAWSNTYLPHAISKIEQISVFIFLAVLILAGGFAWFLYKKGMLVGEDVFTRGQRLVNDVELAKLTSQHPSGSSVFKIGNVAIPNHLLMRNIGFIGSMGTGKSQGIMPLMEAAREANKKSIIYDPTGEFLEYFYRPGDLILNPLDTRCAAWDLFKDLQETHDARTLSNQLIPDSLGSGSDGTVWLDAARGLLADLITITAKEPTPSLKSVHKKILMPLPDLCELLAEHQAGSAATMNAKNPKGSESIRLTLASSEVVRLFHLFPYQENGISLREQTRNQPDQFFIFITSSPSRSSLIKPWAAAWLELLTLGSMECRPVPTLRTLFFLDELASLPRLKSLETALTMARKYGVMSIVGIQGVSQLEAIYGPEMTRVLVGNLQTKAIFRTEDDQSSYRLAEILGKYEAQEVAENANISVSENETHGNTLSHQRREINTVMPAEIQILPDLTCFLKVAGDYPVAKVKFPYQKRDVICQDFIKVADTGISGPAILPDDEQPAKAEPVPVPIPVEAPDPEEADAPKYTDDIDLW